MNKEKCSVCGDFPMVEFKTKFPIETNHFQLNGSNDKKNKPLASLLLYYTHFRYLPIQKTLGNDAILHTSLGFVLNQFNMLQNKFQPTKLFGLVKERERKTFGNSKYFNVHYMSFEGCCGYICLYAADGRKTAQVSNCDKEKLYFVVFPPHPWCPLAV